MADSTINIFGNSGEAMVGADTINTILASMDSKLTSDDINIETLGDGTVDVDVKNDTYTINLNHTHEGMAKLVVDTAANLPDASEMESDTIYGELDDGEIATIYLGGYPFYGGGGGASSGPVLRRPADGATINVGTVGSGQTSVEYSINVKGKSLTQALTIEIGSGSTGYTFKGTQATGVTVVSATELTVTAEAVNGVDGVDIVVVYTGSTENASGSLGITSGTPDNISAECSLIANAVIIEELAGVKFTGAQWLQTDYYPNANTEFEMRCRFIENANSLLQESSNAKGYIFACTSNSVDGKKFMVYQFARDSVSQYNAYGALIVNDLSYNQAGHVQAYQFDNRQGRDYHGFLVDNLKMFYRKSTSNGVFGFDSGGTEYTVTTSLKSSTMDNPLKICINKDGVIYCRFDLVIYELKITEGGTVVRDYVPRTRNGVPGLLDVSTNGSHEFISSETAKTSGLASDELVAIPLT